jgi:DNA-binding FadR family transcriptional regulator
MVLSVEDREFDNPDVVLAEHDAILSAIRSGDRDRAVAEVRAMRRRRRGRAVLVRDTADRSGPVLTFSAEAWRAFTAAIR